MKFLERFWFGCGHCHGGAGCPVAENVDPETGELRVTVHGPALVGIVILVFIVPLATAIIGAYLGGLWLSGPTETLLWLWQLAGAIVGFLAGVGLARLVLWSRRRYWPTDGGVE